MAEALAVVSVVASIIQLVDFGSRVLGRLQNYHSSAVELPQAFRLISIDLPVLLDALRITQKAIDSGSFSGRSDEALRPAIESCVAQIKLLDEILNKVATSASDSWTRKSRRAFASIRHESKVENISKALQGHIQALSYHASASSSSRVTAGHEPARQPFSAVPFRRDPHFIECDGLSQLDSKTQRGATRVALLGLGGVGKSQIAIEYSYRLNERRPDIWIFWLKAGSRAAFEEDYRSIADLVKIPGRDKQGTDLFRLVYHWLYEESNGPWCIIVDNADDVNIFQQSIESESSPYPSGRPSQPRNLLELLPDRPHGSIVVTSRSREAAIRITGSYEDSVLVQPMGQVHAIQLLQARLGNTTHTWNEFDAEKLVEALGCMPLAISQAACYIQRLAPRVTISTYFREFSRDDDGRRALLTKGLHDPRRDGSSSNAIMLTWQTSFEYIRKQRPSAANLLSLLSFFDAQAIPISVLMGHYADSGVKTDQPEVDFDDDLETLFSFALFSIDANGDCLNMHELVQFSTRKWLELNDKHELWQERFMSTLIDVFPGSWDYKNWTIAHTLYPHAERIRNLRPKSPAHQLQWAAVMSKLGLFEYDVAMSSVAVELGQAVLAVQEAALGKEDTSDLVTADIFALSLLQEGLYLQAETFYRKLLRLYVKTKGENDMQTILCAVGLARALKALGEFQEAEEHCQEALQAAKEGLEHDSSHVLLIMNDLALIYLAKGRLDEAEKVLRKVYDALQRKYPPDDQLTWKSLHNLASVLLSQQKLVDGEKIARKAFLGREKGLGKLHPSTMRTGHTLAAILLDAGKLQEADELSRDIQNGQRKIQSRNHPDVMAIDLLRACVIEQCGHVEDAESLFQHVIETSEATRGPVHPSTLLCYHKMALLQHRKGHLGTAQILMKKARDGRIVVFGTQHPDTQESIRLLDEMVAGEEIGFPSGMST